MAAFVMSRSANRVLRLGQDNNRDLRNLEPDSSTRGKYRLVLPQFHAVFVGHDVEPLAERRWRQQGNLRGPVDMAGEHAANIAAIG
jgi:hypothetical protein